MKVGTIIEPNAKGQIVIPKQIRSDLGITPNTPLNVIVSGGGIYIYPVEEVITRAEGEDIYSKILDKTRGSLKSDKPWDKFERQRRALELEQTEDSKKQW